MALRCGFRMGRLFMTENRVSARIRKKWQKQKKRWKLPRSLNRFRWHFSFPLRYRPYKPAFFWKKISSYARQAVHLPEEKAAAENGFTILEMLLVMLVLAVLLQLAVPASSSATLSMFSRNLLLQIQREQFLAFEQRSTRKVAIDEHFLETETSKAAYPETIVCSQQVLLFNERGNIAKGGTVTCAAGSRSVRLIFQLGSGRGRIEYN